MSTHHEYRKLAWRCRGLGPARKALLVALADMVDAEGMCYALIGTLVEMTDSSEPTVFRALNELEKRGLVERIREAERKPKKRKCLFFQLDLAALAVCAAGNAGGDASPGDSGETPRGEGSQNETPAGSAGADPCQSETPGGEKGLKMRPQPSHSETRNYPEQNNQEQTGGRARVAAPPAADGVGARGAPHGADRRDDGQTNGETDGAARQPCQPDPSLAARYREALVRLPAADPLGREALLAWACALIPEAVPDDPHALRLLCPGPVWRSAVERRRATLERAVGLRVVLGEQPEGWGAWRPVPGGPRRFEPAWVEAQRRAVRHLAEVRAVPAELAAPADLGPAGGRQAARAGELAFEATWSLRRAAEVWAAARPSLGAQGLDAEGLHWLRNGVAPLRFGLGLRERPGAPRLDLVPPGQQLRVAHAAFADRREAVEAAVQAAWGAPVETLLTVAPQAEDAAAAAALAEIAAAEAANETARGAAAAEADAVQGETCAAETAAPDVAAPEAAGPDLAVPETEGPEPEGPEPQGPAPQGPG